MVGRRRLAIDATGNVNIGGVTSTSDGVHIGRDPNAYIEMAGGTPHIDLKYNGASDFDARIMLRWRTKILRERHRDRGADKLNCCHEYIWSRSSQGVPSL